MSLLILLLLLIRPGLTVQRVARYHFVSVTNETLCLYKKGFLDYDAKSRSNTKNRRSNRICSVAHIQYENGRAFNLWYSLLKAILNQGSILFSIHRVIFFLVWCEDALFFVSSPFLFVRSLIFQCSIGWSWHLNICNTQQYQVVCEW